MFFLKKKKKVVGKDSFIFIFSGWEVPNPKVSTSWSKQRDPLIYTSAAYVIRGGANAFVSKYPWQKDCS